MASDSPLKARLRWQCRRGMLELDYILLAFLDHQFDNLNTTEQRLFETLLTHQDKNLISWILNKSSPTDIQMALFIKKYWSE